jgi:hypothetical protein
VRQSTPVAGLLSVSPTRLAAAFAHVPDRRRAASVSYPLPAILAMAVAAILANHLSVLAIAEWGARQDGAMLAARGFPADRTPCQSTLQRLVRQLDGDAMSATLSAWWRPSATPATSVLATPGVAIDGKAQRGRLRFARAGCPVHALSAFCHDAGVVLAHEPITAGPDKAEAELSVAPALLARVAWEDRVLTGDALFCQRTLCEQLQAASGYDVLLVEADQGTLSRDSALLCDPPPAVPAAPLTDRRVTCTVEAGHGRSQDRRELIASTDLTDYLDWPGGQHVFRLEEAGGNAARPSGRGIAASPACTREPPTRRGCWRCAAGIGASRTAGIGTRTSISGRMPA